MRLIYGTVGMEFELPFDYLDIDTFYRTGAYASLDKAYGKTVDERKVKDITVAIICESKSVGLFGDFKEHGINITYPYKGLYHVLDTNLFSTQIIVTKELNLE